MKLKSLKEKWDLMKKAIDSIKVFCYSNLEIMIHDCSIYSNLWYHNGIKMDLRRYI